MELTIYCSWCSEHPFKVDKETASLAGTMLFTGPRCRRDTQVNFRPGAGMSVLPGDSKSSLRGGHQAVAGESSFILHDESKPLTHLRQGETTSKHYMQQRGVRVASAMPAGAANAQKPNSSISQTDHPPATLEAQSADKLFSSRTARSAEPNRGKTWRIEPEQLPWYDKPSALEILEERRLSEGLSDDEYKMLFKWATEGYCVVSGIIPDSQIDSMMLDFEKLWTAERPFEGLQFYDLRLGPNGSPVTLSHTELLKVDLARRQRLHILLIGLEKKLTRKSYVIHYVPPGMNVGNDVVGPFNW